MAEPARHLAWRRAWGHGPEVANRHGYERRNLGHGRRHGRRGKLDGDRHRLPVWDIGAGFGDCNVVLLEEGFHPHLARPALTVRIS